MPHQIPRNPRPRPGITDEYRKAIGDACATLPGELPHDPDHVAEWMHRHGWRVEDFDKGELEFVGEVLAAVALDLTLLLLIEETPTDPAAAEEASK